MRYETVPGVPRPVSKLTLGSMIIPTLPEHEVYEILEAWVDNGGTMVDTARIYGGGKSEELLGNWLASGNRDRLMILGKGCHHDAKGHRVTAEALRQDIEQSLEALQTHHIELYLLHRDDPDIPVGEVIDWLNEHRQAGNIGAFGGSNWAIKRIRQANEYARNRGVQGFAATSNYFGLATTNENMWPGVELIDESDADWYSETGTVNFAWSSLGRGYFAGKGEGPNADDDVARVYVNEINSKRRARAEELGNQKGLSGIQIAGAYAINQPFASIALVGASSVEEVCASTIAADIELTDAEVRWLESGI